MPWYLIACVRPVLMSVVKTVDKVAVERLLKSFHAILFFSGFASFLGLILITLVCGVPNVAWPQACIMLGVGMALMGVVMLYYKAISIETAGNVALLFQIGPLFTLVLGWLLLGESITLRQLAGFLLILGVVLAISLKRDGKQICISRAVGYALVCALIIAIADVLFKWSARQFGVFELVPYEFAGNCIATVLIMIGSRDIRDSVIQTFRDSGWKSIIVLANESLFHVAQLVTYIAYAAGPIALVSIIGSLEIYLVYIYTWIGSCFAKSVFQEPLNASSIVYKSILTGFVLIGLWLIL